MVAEAFQYHEGLPAQQMFLGLGLAECPTAELLERVLRLCAARERSVALGYLNAAQVNMAFADRNFARDLRRLDLRYADGQAVVWAANWRGQHIAERINAGDCTRELMLGLAERGLKLALIGGHPPPALDAPNYSEAELAARQFRAWAPGLEIVYTHHGYLGEGDTAEQAHAALEAADPDLVLLGMGAPRQEHWALEWALRGRPRIYWCVGALFEYYAGTRLRAPRWLRRLGLEWLVRLVLEPGRLWKRYLIGNPLFVWRVLRGKPPRF